VTATAAAAVPKPTTAFTRLAKTLEEGASADIFYDAADFGDTEKAEIIEATQNAMSEAARVLRSIHPRTLPEMATADEIESARRLYANDDVSIDEGASSSRVDRGVWVQAWVFVDGSDR
jgi:hypothetical protein